MALKYKLDGIELRSVWEKGPHELQKNEIARIKSILADTRLEVSGISAPFFKCDLDNDNEIQQHIDILKRSVELAHETGCGIIRGFTFWRKGSLEQNLGKIAEQFEVPAAIMKDAGMTLALEFDPSVYASNAAGLVKVLKEIDSPHVKGLWDPGNDIYEPNGEIPFPDGYNIIKPYMVHMHLKDALKQPDGKIIGVPIGEGQVNYRDHFKTLLQDNYKGFVVLETHYRPKHDISKELLALPKGSAFSYLGYEATEECLIMWEKLMADITAEMKGIYRDGNSQVI